MFVKGIGKSVPEFKFTQKEAYQVVSQTYGERFPAVERYFTSFDNSKIETRYSASPLQWFYDDHGWKERSSIFKKCTIKLAKDAITKCLTEGKTQPTDIDAVIAVSTTGIMTPSLDSYLMDVIPFRSDLIRIPIFGWGCAGGLLSLGLAQELLQSPRIKNVLVICVELCTLSFFKGATNAKDVISTSLFGDGAAAVLVSKEEAEIKLNFFMKHRWPDSIELMGWNIENNGLSVIFSQKIPEIVRTEYPKVLGSFLSRYKRSLKDYKHFLAHPGGPRVIDYLEAAYGLGHGDMHETRKVLSQYGNMSSPTVLFVLDELRKNRNSGRALVSTLGPGFTSGILEIEF
ncbi:MAG: hypothetical protein A4S09_07475 [Proteobacteria bacterium SG_bin7]|nr:MAG: hypothetical protein A4S09_07475 [Proteobacteria bacterium SG_bin7]